MELSLKSPVQYLPRVGPTMAKRLEKLEIRSVEDLLYYAPFRYNDFSLVSPIGRVQPGEVVTVSGTVESIKNVYTQTGKKIQQARVADGTGTLTVVWFNQPFLVRTIPSGSQIHLSGPVRWFGRSIVLESPEYEIVRGDAVSLHTGRLVPVYSETAGVTSKWLRGRMALAIDKCLNQVAEYLPASILATYKLTGLPEAITAIHFPETQAAAQAARRRLAFDELFLLQLQALAAKQEWRKQETGYPLTILQADVEALIASLPFQLTADQRRAMEEILTDLAQVTPMNRLLEGDVGSGKTIVAAMAMYVVFRNSLRSVLMAPTQILAQQHFETLSKFLSPSGIRVGLITAVPESSKFKAQSSKFDVLVGTHALLSQQLKFDKVALVVIDEQQRFGVSQRSLLRQKSQTGKTPHFLTMTATPIPRTVAKTIYSHLELSVLREMPQGRKLVKTWVVPNQKRAAAYEWIKQQLHQHQSGAFIVCPLIEESESLTTVKAAKAEFSRLAKEVFSDFKLGLLHGKLKAREKEAVVSSFRQGQTQILVTTPVVEVGIDIPKATIMLIEAADRFGLAQLHQLRGRVGRGKDQAYCLLFTEIDNERALTRLKALETTHNGPELAELDLALRGPGELFGTKQHGLPELKIASLFDSELIHQTQQAVRGLLAADPNLTDFPLLRQKLEKSKIEAVSQD